MDTGETVSVIIPAYEVADYLDDCIRSVVSQTYRELEIILVDDGSSDGSEAICDEWAAKDERIRAIHQTNRGVSGARNAGLDHATGDYIVFVDSDDSVANVLVEKLRRAIVEMEVPCVACGYSIQGPGDVERLVRPSDKPEVIPACLCLERALPITGKEADIVSVTPWGKIYHRSLFEGARIRFPEGEVYEDRSVFAPLVCESGRIGLIPDVLYFKRERVGSITHTLTVENIRDFERAGNRFAQCVNARCPNLRAKVNRFLEKRRIEAWMHWQQLWVDEGSQEARDAAHRIRTEIAQHRHDLALPTDIKSWLAALLIRYAPGLALPARKAWQALRNPTTIRKNAVG